MKEFLSQEAIKELNYRINQEEFSARIYEGMNLWFDDRGYKNFAALYTKYAEEEWKHSKLAKEFLLSFKIKPELQSIEAPPANYESCYEILESTLEHEAEVSRQCQELAINSLKRGEIMLHTLALQYCKEQIEEMDKSYTILDISKLTTDMLVLDQYIGETYLD